MNLTTVNNTELFDVDVAGSANITTGTDAANLPVTRSATNFSTGANLLVNGMMNIGDALVLDNSGNATFNDTLVVGNEWRAEVDGTLTANTSVTVENAIDLRVGESVTFDSTLTSNQGSLTIQGGDDLNFNGNVSINVRVSLTITDQVRLATGRAFYSGASVTVDSASLIMGNAATLESAGHTTLTTSGDQSLATLTVGGSLDTDSTAGSVAFRENVTVTDTITVDAANSVKLVAEQTMQSGLNTSINSDNIHFADDSLLNVDGSLNLTTSASQQLGQIEVDGNLDIDGGDIQLLNDANILGNIDINASGATSMAQSKILRSVLDTQIHSGSVDFETGSVFDVDGNLELNTQSHSQLHQVSVDGGAVIITGSDLTVDDQILVAENLSLTNQGNAIFNGLLSVGTGLTGTIGETLTINRAVSVEEDIDLLVGGLATFNDSVASAAGNIRFEGKNALAFNNNVNAGESIDLLVTEGVTLASSQSMAAGRDISINSQSLEMGADSQLNAGNDLSIETSGDQILATLLAGNDFRSLSREGQIAFNESVAVTNAVSLNAANDITLAANQLISASSMAIGSRADAGAERFLMADNARITTDNQTLIHTRGNQVIGQLTSDASDQAFYLKAVTGSITGRDDLDINAGERHLKASQRVGCDLAGENCTAPESYLAAGTGIGDPLVIDLPWLSAETDEGDINIIASADLHARLLRATNGNIYMTSLGYLEIDELVGTPWLLVNDFLFADSMTIDKGGISSLESIEINEVNMTDEGPLALYAPRVSANINGGGEADTFMALGGFDQTLSLDSDARNYYQVLESTGFVPTSRAEDIRVDHFNADRLSISNLLTQGGFIRTTGDFQMDIADITAEENYRLELYTGYQSASELSMDINNSNGGAIDVDGQFMTPFGPFNMTVEGVNVTTNAQFTRYRLPLLLTYNGTVQDNTSSAQGVPVAFYRQSAEYQNAINDQLTAQNDNTDFTDGDTPPDLISFADNWFENLPAPAAGNSNDQDSFNNEDDSENEDDFWLITTEKDSES